MSDYKRLKENIHIMSVHNRAGYTVKSLTGGKTEYEVIDEIVSDCSEILNKIEQGTLIELPCKVGDTVYFAYPNDDNDGMIIDKGEVYGISHQKDGIWVYARYKSGLTYWHKQEEIGEGLFLAREEAEKRLKELQE